MTAIRLSQHPKGYQEPPRLPLVKYTALLGRTLPPCSECGGNLYVEPPDVLSGRVICLLCSKEYAEVVDVLPVRTDRELFPNKPLRGRPPKIDHSTCGGSQRCNYCRTARWRKRQKVVTS